MKQCPSSEADRFVQLVKKFPCILWNPKVHCRICKCPPPVPILSQLDPVHTPTSYFLKIHLITILPSTPGSPRWSLSLRFPHQNPVYTSPPYALHAPPISFYSLTFSKHDTFLRRGVVNTSPNPHTGGPPFVGCPRLLIQYIRSYPTYWRPFLHPQREDAPCRGDRDPLITGILRLCTNFRYTRMTSVFLWVFPKQAFSYDAPFSVKSIHCAYFSKWGWRGGFWWCFS